jgi:hypothetical protein
MFFKLKNLFIFLFIFFVILFFIIYIIPINHNISITVLEEHKYCDTVNDCTSFYGSCTSGCYKQPINKNFESIYLNKKNKACKFYNVLHRSLHCDPVFPLPILNCKDNKCTY